jgi:hypothetical protein
MSPDNDLELRNTGHGSAIFERTDRRSGLIDSGYSEFTTSGNETVYAIITDDRLVTHITVTGANDGWTVSQVGTPGY